MEEEGVVRGNWVRLWLCRGTALVLLGRYDAHLYHRQMDLSHAAQQTCSCLVVWVLHAEEQLT